MQVFTVIEAKAIPVKQKEMYKLLIFFFAEFKTQGISQIFYPGGALRDKL